MQIDNSHRPYAKRNDLLRSGERAYMHSVNVKLCKSSKQTVFILFYEKNYLKFDFLVTENMNIKQTNKQTTYSFIWMQDFIIFTVSY